jgi:hypothetical protein
MSQIVDRSQLSILDKSVQFQSEMLEPDFDGSIIPRVENRDWKMDRSQDSFSRFNKYR